MYASSVTATTQSPGCWQSATLTCAWATSPLRTGNRSVLPSYFRTRYSRTSNQSHRSGRRDRDSAQAIEPLSRGPLHVSGRRLTSGEVTSEQEQTDPVADLPAPIPQEAAVPVVRTTLGLTHGEAERRLSVTADGVSGTHDRRYTMDRRRSRAGAYRRGSRDPRNDRRRRRRRRRLLASDRLDSRRQFWVRALAPVMALCSSRSSGFSQGGCADRRQTTAKTGHATSSDALRRLG
jgi:hypothetical protein